MPVISNSVVIRCTPEEGFDYLSELEWNPTCQMMEKITDGPVRAGTKFRAKWKLSPVVELEILEYDRPCRWKVHNGGALEVTMTIRLEPAPRRHQAPYQLRRPPARPAQADLPHPVAELRADEKANMSHIREALERRHPPTQAGVNS